MIALDRCAALLLCAGLSRRFGPDNKLLEPLGGKPLVALAAALVAAAPFASRLAVVAPGDARLRDLLETSGLTLVDNPEPEAGRDHSLRLGLAAALATGAEGIMVLLGDMPHVTADHLAALSEAAVPTRVAISHDGTAAMPSTLIPAAIVGSLLANPHQPVRTLLGEPTEIRASPALLADYDTRTAFEPGQTSAT